MRRWRPGAAGDRALRRPNEPRRPQKSGDRIYLDGDRVVATRATHAEDHTCYGAEQPADEQEDESEDEQGAEDEGKWQHVDRVDPALTDSLRARAQRLVRLVRSDQDLEAFCAEGNEWAASC